MDAIKAIVGDQIKAEPPVVKVGSTVRVHVNIREGARERIQIFEGTVIAKNGSGISETFTVRRMSYGVGIERVFPIHSPKLNLFVQVKFAEANFITFVTVLVRQQKLKKIYNFQFGAHCKMCLLLLYSLAFKEA